VKREMSIVINHSGMQSFNQSYSEHGTQHTEVRSKKSVVIGQSSISWQ